MGRPDPTIGGHGPPKHTLGMRRPAAAFKAVINHVRKDQKPRAQAWSAQLPTIARRKHGAANGLSGPFGRRLRTGGHCGPLSTGPIHPLCIGGATGLSLFQQHRAARRGHCPKTKGFNRLFQDCSDQVAFLHSRRHSALKKMYLLVPVCTAQTCRIIFRQEQASHRLCHCRYFDAQHHCLAQPNRGPVTWRPSAPLQA